MQSLGGIAALILFVLLLILSIYWLIFPWFVYSKMNRMIAHLEKIERGIMCLPVRSDSASSTPIAPAAVRYFVANDKEVTGPFDEAQIRDLNKKGLVTAESHVLVEGATEWKSVDAVFKF